MLRPVTLAEWAVRYAEMGWAVHPLLPAGKLPATAHGCKDATCDPERIARWWARHPNHNIGLATGHVFDVLDLDGSEGIDSFDRWWALVMRSEFPDLNQLLIVGTPRGGQHWYGPVSGAGNRVRFLPDVDWRGQGGYVVAPPSIHPNGGTYQWLNDPANSAPFPWPPGLVELVLPRPIEFRPKWAVRRWEGPGHGTPYGVAGLDAEARKVASAVEGTRNHQLFSSAVAVLELVAGGQLGEETAIVVLTHAALHAGLGESEIGVTIRSAQSRPVDPRRPV